MGLPSRQTCGKPRGKPKRRGACGVWPLTLAELSDDVVGGVLGIPAGVPVERQVRDEWGGGRVECVAWVDPRSDTPRRACVKFGDRPSLGREALVQSALLDAEGDPGPAFLGCRRLASGWVLALGWVDGRRPDFTGCRSCWNASPSRSCLDKISREAIGHPLAMKRV